MKIYDLVKQILRDNRGARSSDKELIWEVFLRTESNCGVNFVMSKDAFMNMPAFESITRARRKVQQNHPELAAVKEVKQARDLKETKKGNFVYHEDVR